MNTTSQKYQINKIGKPTINISDRIFGNFYSLHTKFKNLEWSGYIFYDTIGSLEDPDNMIVNITDFILLDIGTSGATDIQPTGEQIVDIYSERPHLMGKSFGCLHTHHSMGLFFSGTDTDTLLESAPQFDMFVSVIVNHKDHPIAKISQAGIIESIERYAYKIKGNTITQEPVKVIRDVICVYDCIVKIDETLIEKELGRTFKIYEERRSTIKNSYTSYISKNFRSLQDISKYPQSKQFDMFEDDWNTPKWEVPNYSNLSIKEKSIDLLKMCLMQMDFVDGLTLDQCREEYRISKMEMNYTIEELRKETEDCVDDFIETLFTKEELTLVNNIKDITTHLDIINDNSQDEKLIVSIIKTHLDGYKHSDKV